MKKILVAVLALALLLSATVGLAVDNNGNISSASDSAAVQTKYTATDPISITLKWDTPTTIAYTWDSANDKWTTAATAQDVVFTANNNGFTSRKVTLSTDFADSSTEVIASAKLTGSAATVAGKTDNVTVDTLVITPNATVGDTVITGSTTEETNTDVINVTVTVE